MHHLLKIIPLVVLLIASYYFYDWVNIQEKTELTQLIEAQPVFTAKNINTRQFNPDGRLYQSIFAREAEYYQSIEQTNFVSPVVLYTPTLDTKNKDVSHLADKVSEEWLIQADSGTVSVDNLITLRDNVIVKSSNEVPNVAPVQEPVVELPVQNETPIVKINEPMVKAPVQNIDSNVDKVPTLENTNVENNINNVEINKKKSDTLFYVVLGVLSFAIVAAVVYLLFFSNK